MSGPGDTLPEEEGHRLPIEAPGELVKILRKFAATTFAYGRFSGLGQPRPMIVGNILRIDDGRLAEHWEVVQDEATAAESKSGLPMIGVRFLMF